MIKSNASRVLLQIRYVRFITIIDITNDKFMLDLNSHQIKTILNEILPYYQSIHRITEVPKTSSLMTDVLGKKSNIDLNHGNITENYLDSFLIYSEKNASYRSTFKPFIWMVCRNDDILMLNRLIHGF